LDPESEARLTVQAFRKRRQRSYGSSALSTEEGGLSVSSSSGIPHRQQHLSNASLVLTPGEGDFAFSSDSLSDRNALCALASMSTKDSVTSQTTECLTDSNLSPFMPSRPSHLPAQQRSFFASTSGAFPGEDGLVSNILLGSYKFPYPTSDAQSALLHQKLNSCPSSVCSSRTLASDITLSSGSVARLSMMDVNFPPSSSQNPLQQPQLPPPFPSSSVYDYCPSKVDLLSPVAGLLYQRHRQLAGPVSLPSEIDEKPPKQPLSSVMTSFLQDHCAAVSRRLSPPDLQKGWAPPKRPGVIIINNNINNNNNGPPSSEVPVTISPATSSPNTDKVSFDVGTQNNRRFGLFYSSQASAVTCISAHVLELTAIFILLTQSALPRLADRPLGKI
uniref:Uncharacterized protein n=1 Tax=Schistocephalus solidus TaxID=70667 RepID=A0A183TE25_SCHSO